MQLKKGSVMKAQMYGAAVALAMAAAASSQVGPVAPYSIPVHDLTMSTRVFDALPALARKYHVVIGLYGTHVGHGSQPIEISIKDGTLGEAFDAIVRGFPQLEWVQASTGAVHFTFRDSPISLFDVAVPSFDAEGPGRMEAPGLLARTPEVARWLRDNGCTMSEMVVVAGRMQATGEWGKFAIHAKDAPLQAVFDEIAAKSGSFYWSAIKYNSQPCEINVGF